MTGSKFITFTISLSDKLSLEARVNEEDVVHYALEGLPKTYNQVCGYMHWKDTFTDLKAVRSLLIAEDMRFKSKVLAFPVDSSSPMVLMAEASTNSRSFTSQGRGTSANMTNEILTKLLAQLGHLGMNVAMSNNDTYVTLPNHATGTPTVTGPNIASNIPTTPHAFYASPGTSLGPNFTPPLGFPPLAQAHLTPLAVGPVHTTMGPINYVSQAMQPTGSLVMGLVPSSGMVNTSGQATLLPQAFTTGTLHNPTLVHGIWIQVGDGHSIPVTNTGHNILSTPLKSLRLNNHRDLYPVTTPSSIPSAFLVSQQMWHQRLGHLGGDVMRRLISNNVISPHSPTTAGTAQQTPTHITAQSTSAQSAPNITHPLIIPDQPVNPNPISVHFMVIRFRVESKKPTQRLNFHVSSVSPLPKTYRDAFHDSNWQNATRDDYNALIKNSTRSLVPRSPDANVVRCMWLFRHKFLADVKPGTIRMVLSLAVSRHWPIHQLDVKNAFLHVDLTETVYMHQPPGFRDSTHYDYVCLLQRSLYGPKQAPRAWFQQFASYITREFAMRDLGPLNYFLGVSVTRDSSDLFLSQQKYAVEILEKAYMLNCNPSRTPVDTESELGVGGDPVSDPTLYRSLADSLRYLTFTRPDIFYAVQQVCLHMHDPPEPRLSALKRILRYVHEAEYRGVANVVTETCWLRNLLRELHTPLSSATLVYCDSVNDVYLSCNPVQHQRTKHIEIDIHFVRDLVATGHVCVLHVPSRYQFTIFSQKGYLQHYLKSFDPV
uniref:Reverse transcriptase Ty1/copia-type domain-containing protein n=1 Tax=Tanacetum cinerariifolium TaxID=118510 RepID=A0A6L2MH18_TANCI|nr:hypothetical protein [Tanacetum cinerariifolium]